MPNSLENAIQQRRGSISSLGRCFQLLGVQRSKEVQASDQATSGQVAMLGRHPTTDAHVLFHSSSFVWGTCAYACCRCARGAAQLRPAARSRHEP